LDIGTGSGILAIAAAKLGYSPVHAFDFDPVAVKVARGNAEVNGVSSHVKLTQGDLTKLPWRPARRFDFVTANLISTLQIAEAERIAARVTPTGFLVLAGILDFEFGQVRKAYGSRGFRLVSSASQQEWRSGAFCRVK
jgi:ribosomal protein L11 methyltransferase